MSQPFDASRSLTALEQDSTIIAAIEIAQSKWLVAAVVPGIKRQPLKKLDADEESLSKLLYRWRKEADQAGHPINTGLLGPDLPGDFLCGLLDFLHLRLRRFRRCFRRGAYRIGRLFDDSFHVVHIEPPSVDNARTIESDSRSCVKEQRLGAPACDVEPRLRLRRVRALRP